MGTRGIFIEGDGRMIGMDDVTPFVIAEIGHNHQGNLELAHRMIERARECGADAVKLQKRDNRTLYPPEVYDRPYTSEHSFGATYGEHREALEFGREEYLELKAHAEARGLVFFATAFDMRSVDFLEDLGVKLLKIASFDVRSLNLIAYAAATAIPLIISTGTASDEDVRAIYEMLPAITRRDKLALLHCTSEYPTPAEHLNLRAIETLRASYPEIPIGFSSHFNGISMPLLAYGLGARIFEVHFTLDRTMKGSDQAWSLEPVGLRSLVRDLRRAHDAMGDGVKRALAGEMPALEKAGKPTFVVTP